MAFPRTPIDITLLVGVVALFATYAYLTHIQSGVTERHREPIILVPGVQEPEEMRVEPFPKFVPTAPEQMLAEADKDVGNISDPALLPELDRILTKYPEYSDGYIMRLGALCEGNDRVAIQSNINSALKFIDTSRVGKKSYYSLLSMQAKIEHSNGDALAALKDLEKAVQINLGDAINFANSGGVAPEKTASICTWTEPDMDALVRRFAGDYRPYLFRALYHGFFLFFEQDDKTKRASLSRAFDDLNVAAKLNPSSVLPYLFKAEIFYRTFGLHMMNIYNPEHDEFNNQMINLLDATLASDHDNVWALEKRAAVYAHLKKWQQAIVDYDRALALDPKNFATLNDRALAKIEVGDEPFAISDLSEVIRNTERELQNSNSYEARADAYMKTRQWELAIRDLTTAISLQIGGQVLVMNVSRFRALYPEYSTATDEAIARKLQQTFYPNLSYENFSKGFLHTNDPIFPDFVVADIYLKRSEAFLGAGNWRAATLDFRRAEIGYSGSPDAIDRWREISPLTNSRLYIDMRTFNPDGSEPINVWIKQARDETSPYSLEQFELNCGPRQIRMKSSANYDAVGNLTASRQGGNWASIVPETLGEILYNGACRRS